MHMVQRRDKSRLPFAPTRLIMTLFLFIILQISILAKAQYIDSDDSNSDVSPPAPPPPPIPPAVTFNDPNDSDSSPPLAPGIVDDSKYSDASSFPPPPAAAADVPPPSPNQIVQPIVTVTAPAVTARPTRKFSKPLPQCILSCLQKAVIAAGCRQNDQACACVNPVYQISSQTCIKYGCTADEQELASHVQQKCGDKLEVRPTIHASPTRPEPASLTTNFMAVMTGRTNHAVGFITNDGLYTNRIRAIAGFLGIAFVL